MRLYASRVQQSIPTIWYEDTVESSNANNERVCFHPDLRVYFSTTSRWSMNWQVNIDFYFCRIRHKCPDCSKDFSRKDHLKRHQNITHGGIRHQCPVCPKKFGEKSYIKVHLKSIHGKILYQAPFCTGCGMKFNSVGDNFCRNCGTRRQPM